MRLAHAAILGLVLLHPTYVAAQDCACTPKCRCVPPGARLDFGVDRAKLQPQAEFNWHPHALEFFAEWKEFPSKALDAVWYGVLAGSCGGFVLAGLVIANAISGGRRA